MSRGRAGAAIARNRSFRSVTPGMSDALKLRAPGWPLARYGRSRGRRLRAPIADDGRALVLPADVPVRQWVLSVPHPLRYRLAYDHRLCRAVLHVFVRALRIGYRRQARRQGLTGGETGMVTSVQRFGGAVNVHLHFHTLALDGVFVQEPDGTLRFHAASPPTDDDVRRVVARVRRRLERLGVTGAASANDDVDPL